MYWIGVGDIHEQPGNLGRIPGIRGAAGVLVSGDLTNRGTAEAAREVLEQLRQHNKNIHAVIGNMDTEAVHDYLVSESANLHMNDLRLFDNPRIGAIGVGYSTPTPFATPSEVPDEQIATWLEQAWELSMPYDYVVGVIHNPPLDSTTDNLGDGTHVGSEAVREFIEKHNPVVVLTGHIHEAKSLDVIGSTTVINTGMLAHGGYAKIRVEGGRIKATLEQL